MRYVGESLLRACRRTPTERSYHPDRDTETLHGATLKRTAHEDLNGISPDGWSGNAWSRLQTGEWNSESPAGDVQEHQI